MTRSTWKVMVYFAGQNRLADDMVASLKNMKSVGSDNNVTLLAEYSAKWLRKKYSSQTELATPMRFHFQANKKWVVSDHVDPGKYERPAYNYIKELSKFILWAISYKYRPTDRYMIICRVMEVGPFQLFFPQ